MTNASRDENHVSGLLAVLNTDTVQGTNIVPIKINSDSILTNTTATISFTPVPVDPQDENYRNVWLFEGSDGLLYPAVATSAGELLIEP